MEVSCRKLRWSISCMATPRMAGSGAALDVVMHTYMSPIIQHPKQTVRHSGPARSDKLRGSAYLPDLQSLQFTHDTIGSGVSLNDVLLIAKACSLQLEPLFIRKVKQADEAERCRDLGHLLLGICRPERLNDAIKGPRSLDGQVFIGRRRLWTVLMMVNTM